MARLRFTLTVKGLPEESFVVRDYQGKESLSDSEGCNGFRYQINLASRQGGIAPEQVVDSSALLCVWRNGECVQRVQGVVQAFSQGDTGHHHSFYRLTLVPALERLSLRHNSRIFQQQSVPQIISTLLEEMGITDYALSLEGAYPPREYCVQYRETDLMFLQRLCAEEGIVYRIEHDEHKHTVVFSNTLPGKGQAPLAVAYHPLTGGQGDEAVVSSLDITGRSAVNQVVLKEYSFKKPAYDFLQQAQTEGSRVYEHYDAPGRYKDDEQGKTLARARLAYLQRQAIMATGRSDQAALQAGVVFTLTGHPFSEVTRWQVVEISHQGSQPQALEESGGSGQTTYHNQFILIPADRLWQAIPQPKPLVDGPCIATVTGPEGEEIFCDEYGRVKVHFPWNRYNEGDEHSSCWVRVSQGWAGAQYGIQALPRIGHEVIVSFLNGDPDQPIITGRTYHAANPLPYPLPAHKTKTVLRTQTHQGEGYNELSFEDQADNELVYLHAQKDMQVRIGNSERTEVNYDQSTHIGHDEMRVIAHDRKVTVDGKQEHLTKGDYISEVQGDKHDKVLGDLARKIEGVIGISANGDITIKSGSKITLQVGGSFVVVDESGVAIDGGKILIKSGGSPGALALPADVAVMEGAAAEGSAFVANCPKEEG